MQSTITINGQVVWAVKNTRVGTVVGVCEPLGLALEADDQEELSSMIEETLHHVLAGLFSEGTFEKFLRTHGWSTTGPLPVPEDGIPHFDLPFKIESATA